MMISHITNELTILAQKLTRLERKPFDFGTGEVLTKAEIHTIEAIGKNQGCTVSTLCEHFSVTKGAVSQVVGKLAAKGYVMKETNLNYVKEKFLTLTQKGEKAFSAHESLHERMDMDLMEDLNQIDDIEIERFRSMLARIGNHVDQYLTIP